MFDYRSRIHAPVHHLRFDPPSPHSISKCSGCLVTKVPRCACSSACHISSSANCSMGSRFILSVPENSTGSWSNRGIHSLLYVLNEMRVKQCFPGSNKSNIQGHTIRLWWKERWFICSVCMLNMQSVPPKLKRLIKVNYRQTRYLKLVRTPLNVYFTAFKSSFSLSLCTYKLGWMSCLISFERCQSSCEERGTSEHYKKFFFTVGFEPSTPAPLVFQRVPLTPRLPRQFTIWY